VATNVGIQWPAHSLLVARFFPDKHFQNMDLRQDFRFVVMPIAGKQVYSETNDGGSVNRIRFGSFEVDTRSGELLRHGAKVRLQEQPFQLLVRLLECPGEVVTREELTKRLWPDDIFVDFERGLNKAVNRLREALRDHADRPRFIETLPQHGYRFIAPVEHLGGAAHAAQAGGSRLAQPIPRIDSLAVLPLDNLSDDPAQEFFSDGMTEELISAISKISSLRVISRTSVMRYKGVIKSLPMIARELRVDAVIEGSVARSEDKVRIAAQLIYGPEDRHLWSGRYERELHNILQLQAEIAETIASKVHKLVDLDQRDANSARRVHPRAYEACLKGSFFRDKLTPEDLEKSIGCFHEAIQFDPNYAQAHVDLSQAYFYLGVFGLGPSSELFPKAKANAVRALQLDESVAAAHNALAAIHILYDWDWARAEAECLRAIQLKPGDSLTHLHLADYMSIQARHEEAIKEFQLALELNPISCVFLGFLGLLLYRARRYDASIAQCRKALEINPYYPNALWFLALALEQKGQLGDAVASLEKATAIAGGPLFRALLGRAYALTGDRAKALEILEELKAMAQRQYVSPFDVAVVHAGLNQRDSVFECLEDAYRQRVFRIIELTMPMFDNLRGDPRWRDLVRRIGLPS
jgi:TolB-like protein/Tfp pilus assembly protein PilF